MPAGIRIYGDPAKITPIIDKLKASAGPDADLVKVSSGDGLVTVGLNPSYVETLQNEGGLGKESAFKDVVPEAGRATGAFFVNFDAGDGWAEQLADLLSDGDAEAKAEHRAARRPRGQRLGRRRVGPARSAPADHRLTNRARRHATITRPGACGVPSRGDTLAFELRIAK